MFLAVLSLVISALAAFGSFGAVVVAYRVASREARAVRPVEWHLNGAEGSGGKMWVTDISCTGADALGFMVEEHHHPFFTRHFASALEVGQIWRVMVPIERKGDGWVVLGWSHPADRQHPVRMWVPLAPEGIAATELRRQQTRSPFVAWVMARVIQAHVRPGKLGIPGRRGGGRDRRIVGNDLRRNQKVAPWEQRLTPWGDPGRKFGKDTTGNDMKLRSLPKT